MDIRIGHGIGDLIFGMKREHVMDVLGPPSEIRELDDECDDDEGRVEWVYNEIKLTARFYDNHEGKLAWIKSEFPNLEIFGKKVIGCSEPDILKIMGEEGFIDYEVEEYDSFNSLDFGDLFIMFYSTYRTVNQIELGVLFDDDDNYIWKFIC